MGGDLHRSSTFRRLATVAIALEGSTYRAEDSILSGPWRPSSASSISSSKLPECSMDRLDEASFRKRFKSEYYLKKPVILTGWSTEASERLKEKTERERFLREFGHVPVLIGNGDILNVRGHSTENSTLKEYIAGWPSKMVLFDRGEFFRDSGADIGWTNPPVLSELGTYADVSKTMKAGNVKESLRLMLAHEGNGLAFHWHQDSYSFQLHGSKRWAIYAPGKMTTTGFATSENFESWLQNRQGGIHFVPPTFECVQRPGEMLYVPEGFHHATANIGDAISVAHHAQKAVPNTAWDQFNSAYYVEDKVKAVQLLDDALEQDNTNAAILVMKGIQLAHQKDFKAALKCYQEAIKLNPLSLGAHTNMVLALTHVPKGNEYIYVVGVKLYKKHPDIHEALVQQFLRIGKENMAEALQETAKAVQSGEL